MQKEKFLHFFFFLYKPKICFHLRHSLLIFMKILKLYTDLLENEIMVIFMCTSLKLHRQPLLCISCDMINKLTISNGCNQPVIEMKRIHKNSVYLSLLQLKIFNFTVLAFVKTNNVQKKIYKKESRVRYNTIHFMG